MKNQIASGQGFHYYDKRANPAEMFLHVFLYGSKKTEFLPGLKILADNYVQTQGCHQNE